jgi:hypothetical protein
MPPQRKEAYMSSINYDATSQLLRMAREVVGRYEKRSFVPAGDPNLDPNAAAAAAGGGGGQGGPPPDPSAGGAPPDPSAGGGAPPAADPNAIAQSVMQMLQPALQQGGAGGGGMEPIKPKIDINVAVMQILKMLARICDAQGIQIPASEMVMTSNDLTQYGMQQQNQPAAGGGAMQPPQPIQPIQPAMGGGQGGGMGKTSSDNQPFNNGRGFSATPFRDLNARASAVAAIRARQLRR